MQRNDPTLVIIPGMALGVARSVNGRPILTKKFLSGMRTYAQHWPGRLVLFAESLDRVTDNLDNIEFDPSDWGFDVELLSIRDSSAVAARSAGAALILANLDVFQAKLATDLPHVPVVYVTENSLRTRCQQVRSECRNPLRMTRRLLYEPMAERRHRKAVAAAAGIQCNGTPTYNAYKDLSSNPLLFFDSRTTADMVVGEAELSSKVAEVLDGGRPLRLAFSGRLTAIKGVTHLARVAAELKRRHVPFVMDIFGSGDEEQQLRDAIRHHQVDREVSVRGAVDFAGELVPFMRREADVFVCCHRQGDPSCTYLETLACGTPIVGYANEALVGLAGLGAGCVTSPMNDPVKLAALISQLASDRHRVAAAMRAAHHFASKHTFEETFRKRVDHLTLCAGLSPGCPMSPHLTAAVSQR